jgi:hypothetical protein
MNDESISARIEALVQEEHAIRTRALRGAGLNPDEASVRDADTVEDCRR